MATRQMTISDPEELRIIETYAQIKGYRSVGDLALYCINYMMTKSPVKGLETIQEYRVSKLRSK